MMPDTNKPLITIVTVSYNIANDIEDTILSVLNQTYPNIEYIVIDGESTDGTVDIIKKYENRLAYWISEKDKGIYDAMNKGIKVAKGDWINFMNAGDGFYKKETLDIVFNKPLSSSLGVIYGDVMAKTNIGLFLRKASEPFFLSKEYIHGKGICHQSMFVKTILAKQHMFDLKYRIGADFKMAYEIYKLNFPFYYINEPIAIYNVEEGTSKRYVISSFKESAKIINRYGTFLYYISYFTFTVKYFISRFISKLFKLLFPQIFKIIKEKRLRE